jgi:hypothetical protein
MKTFKTFCEDLPTVIACNPSPSGPGMLALSPKDAKRSKKKVIKIEKSDSPPQKIDTFI